MADWDKGRGFDLLYVHPTAFFSKPMVGIAHSLPWRQLCEEFSVAKVAEKKDEYGAFTFAKFRENVKRKENLIHAGALLLDIDENGSIPVLQSYFSDDQRAAIIYTTFSSTPDEKRARVIVPFLSPVSADVYEKVWAWMATEMRTYDPDLVLDPGTKDAGRLSFVPCIRGDAIFECKVVEGRPIDGDDVIKKLPPPKKYLPPKPIDLERRDAYVAAALRLAPDRIASAPPGVRHHTLGQEAFKLARPEMNLPDSEIRSALLPAFIAAAGDSRTREGERTIRDAIAARRKLG